MPFTISCPGCDAKLKATEALIGKTIQCPRCSKPVRIGQPSPTAVATMPRMELPPARVEEPIEEAEYEDDESVMQEEELDELPEADDEEDIEEAEPDDDDRGRRPRQGKKRRRPGAPTSDERMMAMFIYLLGIFTGFVGPLILWLVKREESKFIDEHGKEVLNFNITVLIAALCLGMVGAPVVVLTFGVGILIVGPLFMALNVYALVMIVLGAVKANRGEYYEFPVSIRLIK